MVFLCYCTLDHVTRKNPMCYRSVVVEIKPSKNLIEASYLLSFVVWSQERYNLLIEIGFGRHGFFMVSMLNSSGSRQGSSPGSVLCF